MSDNDSSSWSSSSDSSSDDDQGSVSVEVMLIFSCCCVLVVLAGAIAFLSLTGPPFPQVDTTNASSRSGTSPAFSSTSDAISRANGESTEDHDAVSSEAGGTSGAQSDSADGDANAESESDEEEKTKHGGCAIASVGSLSIFSVLTMCGGIITSPQIFGQKPKFPEDKGDILTLLDNNTKKQATEATLKTWRENKKVPEGHAVIYETDAVTNARDKLTKATKHKVTLSDKLDTLKDELQTKSDEGQAAVNKLQTLTNKLQAGGNNAAGQPGGNNANQQETLDIAKTELTDALAALEIAKEAKKETLEELEHAKAKETEAENALETAKDNAEVKKAPAPDSTVPVETEGGPPLTIFSKESTQVKVEHELFEGEVKLSYSELEETSMKEMIPLAIIGVGAILLLLSLWFIARICQGRPLCCQCCPCSKK